MTRRTKFSTGSTKDSDGRAGAGEMDDGEGVLRRGEDGEKGDWLR